MLYIKRSFILFGLITLSLGDSSNVKEEIEELLNEITPFIDSQSSQTKNSNNTSDATKGGADVIQKDFSKIGKDNTNAASGFAHIDNYNYKGTGDLNQHSPKEVIVLQNASNRENNGFIQSIAAAIIGGTNNKDTQT